MLTRGQAGFTKSRVAFYSNCTATFNFNYIRLCGDVNPNPGPDPGSRSPDQVN